MIELLNKQTQIIHLQADIIDEAITLLLQHVQTDDEALGEILMQRELIKEIEADPLEDAGLPF